MLWPVRLWLSDKMTNNTAISYNKNAHMSRCRVYSFIKEIWIFFSTNMHTLFFDSKNCKKTSINFQIRPICVKIFSGIVTITTLTSFPFRKCILWKIVRTMIVDFPWNWHEQQFLSANFAFQLWFAQFSVRYRESGDVCKCVPFKFCFLSLSLFRCISGLHHISILKCGKCGW